MLTLKKFMDSTTSLNERCLLDIKGGAKTRTGGGTHTVTEPNGIDMYNCSGEFQRNEAQGSTFTYDADTKENGSVTSYNWCPLP